MGRFVESGDYRVLEMYNQKKEFSSGVWNEWVSEM